MSQVVARNRHRSGEETRASLLAAARKIGSKTPFSRITVEQLTDAAETSRATFYLYFKNKDEIYLELARETCDLLYGAAGCASGEHEPRDAIELALRGYVSAFVANADVMHLLYTVARADDRFGSLLSVVRSRFHERIERALVQGIADGVFRPLDAPLAARALGGMVESFCVRQVFQNEPADEEECIPMLSDLCYHAVAR